MREELLSIIERNSRIDLKELAVILGVEEIDVVNELSALEKEGIKVSVYDMYSIKPLDEKLASDDKEYTNTLKSERFISSQEDMTSLSHLKKNHSKKYQTLSLINSRLLIAY